MKNIKSPFVLFCLFASYLLLGSCSKEDLQFDANLVKNLALSSSFTGTNYDIHVVLPENYQEGLKYKTIYVLDGADNIDGIPVYEQVADLSRKLSAKNNKQNAIIVGIGGLDYRIRDYTPTKITMFGDEGGGSENYAHFIQYELIPMIHKSFSVDTTAEGRVISGHSLGGTFTGYLFSKHPGLFNNYFTLSPAFWWDDGLTLRFEEAGRAASSTRKSLVFVGCGQFEEGIAILAEEWYLRLKQYYPNCTTAFKKIPNTAHISSAYQDISNALDFYYQNK